MNHLPRNENANQFVQEIGELLTDVPLHRLRQTRYGQAMGGHTLVGFGEYLAAARSVLLYTQQEVALRLDISEAQLVALENGLLPRTAITPQLLRRIAHLLEEDEEILALILDGHAGRECANETHQSANVAGPLRGCSGQRRRGPLQMHTLLFPKSAWRDYAGTFPLFRRVAPLFGQISLLYNHARNLLDFRRTSRLPRETVAHLHLMIRLPVGMVSRNATIVAMLLLVCWLTVATTEPLGLYQGQFQSSEGVSWRVPIVWMAHSSGLHSVDRQADELRSPAIDPPLQVDSYPSISDDLPNDEIAFADEPTMALSTVTSPAAGRGQENPIVRLDRSPYRIVYADNIAIAEIQTRAYIEVDDRRIAAIQFLPNVRLGNQRCISNSRFDLCPI